MLDLIKALKIFMKYMDNKNDCVIYCEHDFMNVNIDPKDIDKDDIIKLGQLGFHRDIDAGLFYSAKYGSC